MAISDIWTLVAVFAGGAGVGALCFAFRHLLGDFLDWVFLPDDDEDHWLADHPDAQDDGREKG